MTSLRQRQRSGPRSRKRSTASAATSTENAATLHEEVKLMGHEKGATEEMPNSIASSDLPEAHIDRRGLVEHADLGASDIFESAAMDSNVITKVDQTHIDPSVSSLQVSAEPAQQQCSTSLLTLQKPLGAESAAHDAECVSGPCLASATPDGLGNRSIPYHETNEKAEHLASSVPVDTKTSVNFAKSAEVRKKDQRSSAPHALMVPLAPLGNDGLTQGRSQTNPTGADISRDGKREREASNIDRDNEDARIPSLRRLRKGKRCDAIQEDHPLFTQHREQRAATPQCFSKAPYAQDKDILASLDEWKAAPEIVYAELLWKYAPDAFLSLVTRRRRDDSQVKDEPNGL